MKWIRQVGSRQPIDETGPPLYKWGMFSSGPAIALYSIRDRNDHTPTFQSHPPLHTPPVMSCQMSNPIHKSYTPIHFFF